MHLQQTAVYLVEQSSASRQPLLCFSGAHLEHFSYSKQPYSTGVCHRSLPLAAFFAVRRAQIMMARPPPMTRATTPKHMLACRKERCRLPYAYHHSGATQEQHGQQDQSQPQHLYRCLPAASSADRSADTKVGGASGEAHLIGQLPSVLLGHRDTLLATVLAPV